MVDHVSYDGALLPASSMASCVAEVHDRTWVLVLGCLVSADTELVNDR